jgi:hypothetical protein
MAFHFLYNCPDKNKEVFMKKLLTVFSLLLMLAVLASADIYVKTKTHTDALSMMGQNQPAKDETTEQWFDVLDEPQTKNVCRDDSAS